MAKTNRQRVREATDEQAVVELEDLAEELEELEETESDEGDELEEDEGSVTTPKMLAKELGINPKVLRAFLRREFPRPTSEKNTSWRLTEKQIAAATSRFTEDEEDDELESDED